jgi:hypothetical protein
MRGASGQPSRKNLPGRHQVPGLLGAEISQKPCFTAVFVDGTGLARMLAA